MMVRGMLNLQTINLHRNRVMLFAVMVAKALASTHLVK